MFDVQYDGRFGKKEESVKELVEILRGIAGKLLNEMDIINEYVKLRAIEQHEKFGLEIPSRAYYTPESMAQAKASAVALLYDMESLESLPKDHPTYILEKSKKNQCIGVCNSAAILIMQLDNIVEELASRSYGLIFREDPHKTFYREAVLSMGVSEERVVNTLISMRTARNGLCHSPSFLEHFEQMSVGKIVFLKNMVYDLVASGNYFDLLIKCFINRKIEYVSVKKFTMLKANSLFVAKFWSD